MSTCFCNDCCGQTPVSFMESLCNKICHNDNSISNKQYEGSNNKRIRCYSHSLWLWGRGNKHYWTITTGTCLWNHHHWLLTRPQLKLFPRMFRVFSLVRKTRASILCPTSTIRPYQLPTSLDFRAGPLTELLQMLLEMVTSTDSLTIEAPSGLIIAVSPTSLRFTKYAQRLSYQVIFTPTISSSQAFYK